jgi:hypothetical protein
MNQSLQTQKDSSLLNVSGMQPHEIRALFELRRESVDQVAAAIGEKANRISDTVSRNRPNRRIRVKLSEHLNISYEKLWGEVPKAPREKAASEPASRAA